MVPKLIDLVWLGRVVRFGLGYDTSNKYDKKIKYNPYTPEK